MSRSEFENSIRVETESQMMALGGRLCDLAEPGDVITLRGDLGAGKTVLARGFIRRGCVRGGQDCLDFDVPSPTFTLVQVYETPRFSIWHFDLYRLEKENEVWELGLEEALDEGVCLIEWPDRAGDLLPEARLDLFLKTVEGADFREIDVKGDKSWMERLGQENLGNV
jgi:tRNA threonylcarbamoyladenosine biosynthesis protein TsaE